MIATVAYTKQSDKDGSFKRVKEQFLIPGDTYSTAEEFVFGELTKGIKGEVILDSLKREDVEDVFVTNTDELDGWYKCKVGFQDPDSEKAKVINCNYYVNSKTVAEATATLAYNLTGSMADFEIKGVTISPIVDVHVI